MISTDAISEYVKKHDEYLAIYSKIENQAISIIKLIYKHFKNKKYDILDGEIIIPNLHGSLVNSSKILYLIDWCTPEFIPKEFQDSFPIEFLYFSENEIIQSLNEYTENNNIDEFKDIIFTAKSKLTIEELEALKTLFTKNDL